MAPDEGGGAGRGESRRQGRNAITGLVRGYADQARYGPLIQRNRAIRDRVLPKVGPAGTDLLLFHEGNIPPAQQAFINAQSGADFIFIDVSRPPPGMTSGGAFDRRRERPNAVREMRGFPAGYRHMCHFWFVDFVDHLPAHRFVARIDEDCVVLDFPDAFRDMAAAGVCFKSAGVITDSPEAVVGMTEFSRFFRAARREPAHGIGESKSGPMTNLMLLDLDHFRAHPAFADYRRAVSDSGMVYSHRWGDLPLWGEFLSMYVEPRRLALHSRDIRYFHGSHGVVINAESEAVFDGLVNVAQGKPARANSALPGWAGSAAAAVNGSPGGLFAFHTDRIADPCLDVDLLAVHRAQVIRIVNRGDACQERALGLLVEVSVDGARYTPIHTQSEPFGGLRDGNPALIDFRGPAAPPPPAFRYLRLRIPREEYLHLDQVEVYAEVR